MQWVSLVSEPKPGIFSKIKWKTPDFERGKGKSNQSVRDRAKIGWHQEV